MKTLLIVLTVIGAIVALAVLLLFQKVSLRLLCDGEIEIFVKYLFLKFKVYPPKEKKGKDKKFFEKKKKSRKETEQKENAKNTLPSKKDGEKRSGIGETVSFVFDIIKRIANLVGSHGKIHVKKMLITVAGDDACDTAVKFGLMCSALGAIPTLCCLFGKAKTDDENIAVVPDFLGEKNSVSADVTVSVGVIYLLSAAISTALDKIKKEEQK